MIVGAFKNLRFFWKKPDQANADYHKDFMAFVKVIEEYGGPGSVTHFPNMIKKKLESKNPGIDMRKAAPNQVKEAKKTIHKKILAAPMLDGANRQKYGELKRGMAENYVTGMNEYLESPEVVLCILTVYKPPAGWNKRRQDAGTASKEGAMFAQTEENNWKANVTCHNCKKKGHNARECPLGWEFQFLVPISGTPIGSGIPIPFLIPKIPVRFFLNSAVKKLRNQNSDFKIWNSKKNKRRNLIPLILHVMSIVIGQLVGLTMSNHMNVGTIPGMDNLSA